MAIRLKTISATDLRPASNIAKRNFTTAITVAGTAGKVVGYWQACFVRLPTGFTNNAVYHMWGFDSGNSGFFSSGNDHWIGIGGSAFAASPLKPRVSLRANGNNGFASTTRDFTAVSALTGNASDVYLLLYGGQNTGTDASPVWQGWAARVLVGGGVSSEVEATALGASYISNAAAQTVFGQIFSSRASTGGGRSPVGLTMENFAHVTGDFPWDTANNRPHHDALLALANGTGAPATLHSYASLIAAQNAGTLGAGGGYANLRGSAKADLAYWWSLSSLTAGLANGGNGGTNALSQANWNSLTGGLEDVATITPAHWTPNPTITAPVVKFIGGRGGRSVTVAGTYQSAFVTGLERRWTSGGTAISGFDWASVGTFSGGTWSQTDTLPVGGPYTLEIRATNNNSYADSLSDWLVGTIMLHHAQSGHEYVFQGAPDAVPGVNYLGLAVASGAQGLYLKLSNQTGGTAATYAQPAPTQVRLASGATPVCGHGSVALLNEWNSFNPGHPLLIVNMAINGSLMPDWADNATAYSGSGTGHATWKFMGTLNATPDGSSGNSSGVVEYLAQLLGRYVDCHTMMWTPGMSSTAGVDDTTAGSRLKYRRGIDDRFSNSASAPWVILPPWRVNRTSPDTAATVAKRQEHIDFVAQLGSRGFLGPQWSDIITDGNPQPGSAHSAFNSTATVGGGSSPTSDQNQVGQARLGRGYGRVLARLYDATVKAQGPMVLAAWWTDNALRTQIEIETGRKLRTLNGAAISAGQFWVSTDNGATWSNSGFAVALDATGTRVVLTKSSGDWTSGTVRVDYGREFPFGTQSDETATERLLDGLLYDDQTHRGGVNFSAGVRPGNVLQGTNRTGVGSAGVPVATRGSAKLVASERWTGSRNVTVRMMAADGVTVLKQKTLGVVGA